MALASVLFTLAALCCVVFAMFLWSRRDSGAAIALTAMAVASVIWNVGVAASFWTRNPTWWLRATDFTYIGVAAMVPAWLCFMLLWTNRGRFVTPWTIGALSLEGILTVIILANPHTHDLIRRLPPPEKLASNEMWVAQSGPLYYWHYGYVVLMMTVSTAMFLTELWRRSQVYRGQVLGLTFAALFPFFVNVLWNLNLTRADFTPVGFTVAIAILTWGVLQQRLLKLSPIAHSTVVNSLPDAVLVVDIFGNVVEANPSANALFDQLPSQSTTSVRRALPKLLEGVVRQPGVQELSLPTSGTHTVFEVQVTDLADSRGHAGGRLVVLRDISQRRRMEGERNRILAEQANIARILSRSLRPDGFPEVPGITIAGEYQPAAAGREVGGDFYDVYRCQDRWAFSLGDVSGKGAAAAAVTALARYTLRALTTSRAQSLPEALEALNEQLLRTEEVEKYLTIVHGRCRPLRTGEVEVCFVLGGHPFPILVPHDEETVAGPVGVPGTAVGLVTDIVVTEHRLILQPGDALVFYTDGVTEARNAGEFFGDEGLLASLNRRRGQSAERLSAGLLNDVLAFQDGRASDDTAILVIQAPIEVPAEQSSPVTGSNRVVEPVLLPGEQLPTS